MALLEEIHIFTGFIVLAGLLAWALSTRVVDSLAHLFGLVALQWAADLRAPLF